MVLALHVQTLTAALRAKVALKERNELLAAHRTRAPKSVGLAEAPHALRAGALTGELSVPQAAAVQVQAEAQAGVNQPLEKLRVAAPDARTELRKLRATNPARPHRIMA